VLEEEEEEEEEDLFVFNDTIEGPRAPAVKPKVGDRFQNIAIISVIPNMVKAGYRG